MANTGYKGFASIEEYYTDDNSLTGISKVNASYLPEYVAPVYDDSSCPVVNSSISLDPYYLQFGQNAGSQSVTITSNYDSLTFEAVDTWISLHETGSAPNLTLQVSVSFNDWGMSRYGEVNIYHYGNFVASVSLEQSEY